MKKEGGCLPEEIIEIHVSGSFFGEFICCEDFVNFRFDIKVIGNSLDIWNDEEIIEWVNSATLLCTEQWIR